MSDVMNERLGLSPAQHNSVGEWRYGPGLATWRERLGADYLLVSQFLDGRNITGQRVIVASGGGYLAVRRAIACVVRMEDGQVVWCHLIRFNTRVEKRPGAQALANALLFDLLGTAPGMTPPVRGASAGAQAGPHSGGD